MSRFLPSIIASQAMKRFNIKNPLLERDLPSMIQDGLQRLYGFQHKDGGWGWWKDDSTDDFMTTYVCFGLLSAQKAGTSVEPSVVKSAIGYLDRRPLTPFTCYVLSLAKEKNPDLMRQDAKDASGIAYLVLAGRKDLAARLPASLPKENGPKAIEEAALVLRALAATDPDDRRIPLFAEWLMEQRQGDAWISTLDSAYAILALLQIAKDTEEPKAKVIVNGKEIPALGGRAHVEKGDGLLRHGENRIEVERTKGTALLFGSASLRVWDPRSDQGGSSDQKLVAVERSIERFVQDGKTTFWKKIPTGSEVSTEDQLRMVVRTKDSRHATRVMVEMPVAAGTEASNPSPAISYMVPRTELRDDRACAAIERLDSPIEFTVPLRPAYPGVYRLNAASAFPMYDPGRRGHSAAFVLKVKGK